MKSLQTFYNVNFFVLMYIIWVKKDLMKLVFLKYRIKTKIVLLVIDHLQQKNKPLLT